MKSASKRCTGCGAVKALRAFAVDRSRPDERKDRCRRCDTARSLAYYHANRDRVLARQRAYYAENRDERIAYSRALRGNPDPAPEPARVAVTTTQEQPVHSHDDVEPLDITCPQCGAPPGYGCWWPTHGEGDPHAARVFKAQAVASGNTDPS